MKYGCNDRKPLKQTVTVQDGYTTTKAARFDHMVTIPDPMTKDCQYTKTDLGQQDPKCFNCNWRQT